MTVTELTNLDAAELSWSCAGDVQSQPAIYVVESSLTSMSATGHHQRAAAAAAVRRRQLHSTDDTAVAWRVVAEVCSLLHGNVRRIKVLKGCKLYLFLVLCFLRSLF